MGYYAFARALLIEHNLDFTQDYLHANDSFRGPHVDESGRPLSQFFTITGHLDNHFTVGPAMLWSPFLLLAHGGVLAARGLGSHVAADGFSAPYRVAMALGTAFYGFLGLLLSFRLTRKYAGERWALLATLGVGGASSLPVYMYFNPSWSHAHSAFCVALFLWYWDRTRPARTLRQWVVLGLIAGLTLNVYYPNAMVLAAPGIEALGEYGTRLRGPDAGRETPMKLFGMHMLFGLVALVCLLPTFLTRYIVYGSPFESGYVPLRDWLWRSPVFLSVLFSANHGLLVWTPVVLLALGGLVFLNWRQPRAGGPFLAAALAFYLFIACYPNWDGLSSFGNRFFVSLTVLFALGLAVLLEAAARWFRRERVAVCCAAGVLLLLVTWNVGFMFQWGTHLVPARGPIDWSEMVRNQFEVVPQQMASNLRKYLFKRKAMMQEIEQSDIEQRKQKEQSGTP